MLIYVSLSFRSPGRGSVSAREDIIRSVVASWGQLASECMNGVQEVLEQLVTSIVGTHFSCAGDGHELREIVQYVKSPFLTRFAWADMRLSIT